MNVWIICPNLWGARLFVADDFNDLPRFLRELPRPRVQLRNEDFETDDDIPELTVSAESLAEETRVARQFMGELSLFLEGQCRRSSFDSIVVCAEKQLLGILLGELGSCTRAKVIGTVEEDLYEVNETDLAGYLRSFGRAA